MRWRVGWASVVRDACAALVLFAAVGKSQLQPVRGVPERADRAECDGAPRPPRSEQVQNVEEEEEEKEAGMKRRERQA